MSQPALKRAIWRLLTFVAAIVVAAAPGRSADGKRVALVIGNGAYDRIGLLKNPRNDARAFAAMLAKVEPRFKVLTGYDLTAAEFARRIDEFHRELQGAEVGLFYFAGHSVQIGSENYLLGVDAAPGSARERDLAGGGAEAQLRAARLGGVLGRMEQLARIRVVFLDACRDNPLAGAYLQVQAPEAGQTATQPDDGQPGDQAAGAANPGAAVTRSAGRGLARTGLAQVQGGAGNGGSYIAFATAPGEVALDGDGVNSPFTAALVRHIAVRGVDIDQAMMQVRRDVKSETSRKNPGRAQVPWSNTSLSDKFYFWPQVAKAGPARRAPAQGANGAGARTAPGRSTARVPARERRQEWSAPSPSLGGGIGAGGF